MSERIAVVDEDNRFLRWTSREEVHEGHLPHRSIQIALFDSEGRLVVQKRHASKATFPSHWDISCSGHVAQEDYLDGPDERLDEVYLRVAHRELKEELGIDTHLSLLGAFPPEPGVHYEHLQLFLGTHDGPYRAQEEEVEQVLAVSPEEFDDLVLDISRKVTPSLVYLVHYLRKHGHFQSE